MQYAAIEQKATLDPAARQTAARVATRIRIGRRNTIIKTGLAWSVGGVKETMEANKWPQGP